MHHEDTRRFSGDSGRLRSVERLARLEVQRVVSLSLEGLQGGKVTDIGTGTGVFAEAYHCAGAWVLGVEPNLGFLVEARHRVPAVPFVRGIAEALPLRDKEFDLAFMGTVLHEADDGPAALKEACRVARQRVVVLEFPYLDEDTGPPLAHRLRPEHVAAIAETAGCRTMTRITLRQMELYIITP